MNGLKKDAMTRHIHIAIAEPSDVIRRGLRYVLTDSGQAPVTVTEIGRAEVLRETLAQSRPDMVVVNPAFGAHMPPAAIRREFPYIRCVMLVVSPGDFSMANLFDDVISVWDSARIIRERILRSIHSPRHGVRRHEPLGQREMEGVACVARGLTNRQIADELHLSHHTVATHRRNISSKLGIHSISGLTAYAISNRLVDLEDIYDNAPITAHSFNSR